MRTLLIIVQKEFRQILRNRVMVPIIVVMPIIQLVLLAYAATFDIKHINVVIRNWDHSPVSRQLVEKFNASPYFDLQPVHRQYNNPEIYLRKGLADIVITIPQNFQRHLFTTGMGEIQLYINAINGSAAGVANVYANSILQDFNRELALPRGSPSGTIKTERINLIENLWYNPRQNYKTFMVPGILVLLVTMIGLFLSSMNIVREREIGTMEQLNVTPIKKYQFITGKLLPFWIISLAELAIGFVIAKLLFNIPIVGSLWLIFGFAALYMLTILGMGLLVSTITETQQQAMFISWFFMVIFILLSGLFTPIESMPHWAQVITWFNPIAWFVRVMRMVLLKGSGFQAISNQFIFLAISAIAVFSAALWRYRKTAG